VTKNITHAHMLASQPNTLPAVPAPALKYARQATAWSAASSDLYTSSRTLYGLALQGNAPRWFAKTTCWPAGGD
jgi:hypothetical protein